jgi:predicted CXXCH cytochrome family protein
MNRRGLLHKMKLRVLIILVLFIQMLGSQQSFFMPHVNGEVVTSTEPKIIITSPETGSFVSETNLTISGVIENISTVVSINLYDGTEQLGTTSEVIENNWTIPHTLSEGIHTLTAKTVVDGVEISSNPIELTIDSTLPNVSFIKPLNGAYYNSKSLEGTSESDATVNICMDCSVDSDGQIIGTWMTTVADNLGNWVYEDAQLTEGSHTVYAKATDRAGNIGNVTKITFTLDTLRPIVLPEISPKQDMTQVALNPTVRVKILDATALDESEEIINKSITVSQNGTKVDGIHFYNSATKEITFTPSAPLRPNSKYNVVINPLGIIDLAGNNAFPRAWSFTTIAITSETHQNPHGSYDNNVNTCGNCHNTHQAKDSNLLSPKSTDDSGQQEGLAADNYCMACHDGTVAPMPENRLNTHTHNAAVKVDGKPSGSACASCHNPHLDWSENNPNLEQDHITYKHLPSNPVDPNKPTEEISSKEQLCESCHETNSGEKIANPAVNYRVFQYNKSSKATGIYEDYDLCLRCHNADFKKKFDKTTDIASYYDNLTEEMKKQYEEVNGPLSFSKREISSDEKDFSRHIIKSQDGSPLAGHIPCAECHDTHGSNNIKLLKNKIGTENPTSFDIQSGEWDANKERVFCLTCHNGKTSIFGVVGKQVIDETTGKSVNSEIPEHDSSKSCTECHSNGNSFIEAAHAPKPGKR